MMSVRDTPFITPFSVPPPRDVTPKSALLNIDSQVTFWREGRSPHGGVAWLLSWTVLIGHRMIDGQVCPSHVSVSRVFH